MNSSITQNKTQKQENRVFNCAEIVATYCSRQPLKMFINRSMILNQLSRSDSFISHSRLASKPIGPQSQLQLRFRAGLCRLDEGRCGCTGCSLPALLPPLSFCSRSSSLPFFSFVPLSSLHFLLHLPPTLYLDAGCAKAPTATC